MHWLELGKWCLQERTSIDFNRKPKLEFLGRTKVVNPASKTKFSHGIKIKHKIATNDVELLLGKSQLLDEIKKIKKTVTSLKTASKESFFQSFTSAKNNEGQAMAGFQGEIWRSLDENPKIRQEQLKHGVKITQHRVNGVPDKIVTTILKARLNLLGNALYANVYKMRNSDICPNPHCYDKEYTRHIFSSCKQMLSMMTIRHNAIQKVIKDAISETCTNVHTDIAVLRHAQDENNVDIRRPDISHAELKGKRVCQIGEITVPFDSNLKVRREGKKQKYEADWIPKRKEDLKDTLKVSDKLATFVIGALGIADTEIKQSFKMYLVSGKVAERAIGKMVVEAMKGSYNIWRVRCKNKWSRRAPAYIRNRPP
jgi:hypothetical protein